MQNRQLDKWVFLCNVRDIYELEWLKNFFCPEWVPILHKSRGTGVYMQILMGIVSTGYDVMFLIKKLVWPEYCWRK